MSAKLDYADSEVECPYCGQKYGVEFDNEYNDPEIGEHQAKCLNSDCEKEFTFGVYLHFTSHK